MKSIKITLIGLFFITATSVFAKDAQHNMNEGKSANSHSMAYYNEMMTRDGYKIIISSKKSFVNGNNEIEMMIFNNNKMINNADVKVKFFMPEMPGMPYMENTSVGVFKDGKYKSDVNLIMNGTWQYQLKFRTEDKKIRTVKGSISY